MDIIVPVTQLRTHIASMLKRLRENPDLVFKITHHKEVVAELRVPENTEKLESITSAEEEVAAFIDAYLKNGLPGKKEAYQHIRQLCQVPADRLPYQSVEEAMQAIRSRGNGTG